MLKRERRERQERMGEEGDNPGGGYLSPRAQ